LGILKIELKRYTNPGNKIPGGGCCDPAFGICTSCTPYFKFTFNGKQPKELKPDVAGTDITYTSNSVQFTFGTWHVSMGRIRIFRTCMIGMIVAKISATQ
jgi:hypothetical protein